MDTERARSLTIVLRQSEQAHVLMMQAAAELSAVNAIIRQTLANQDVPPGLELALDEGKDVEVKLHMVSQQLAAVNRGLQDEVRERNMVDHQLAAAMEQAGGARHTALHDTLTGLPNRALFHDRLVHGIAQAQRHHWILAVLFIDLDKFKRVNDTYGHPAGDAVLRAVANRIAENTRDEDTISRYGGDEFVCLLTQIQNEKAIATLAVKILRAIRVPYPISLEEPNLTATIEASIGISVFPNDGITAEVLIKSADKAMFRAKEHQLGHAFTQ
jgi:diguanylate cyclase